MMDFHLTPKPKGQKVAPIPRKKTDFKKILKIAICIIIGWIVLVIAILIYRQRTQNYPQTIDIGFAQEEYAALHLLALENGIDKERGIAINTKNFSSDEEVLKALSQERIDIAIVEDIAVVTNKIPHDAKIISSVASLRNYKYVVDLKKNIYSLNDIKGKSLGMANEDAMQFWLTRNIRPGDIRINHKKNSQLPVALADATVDGIFTKQPYVYDAVRFEGNENQVMVIDIGRNQYSYGLLLTTKDFLDSTGYQADLYLDLLKSANNYMDMDRMKAFEILAEKWGRDQSYVNSIQDDYIYKLSLNKLIRDQVVLQAKWANYEYLEEGDIQNLFYVHALRIIDPSSVEN